MSAPDAFSALDRPGLSLWGRRDVGEDWAAWLEDPEARLAAAAAGGSSAGVGRGPARRVRLGDRRGVWRVNRHGGWLGGLQGDRYRGTRRLHDEVRLSESLRTAGLDTPAVLLALAVRHGPFWRQHLVTEEVQGARTVFESREDPAALERARAFLECVFDLGVWAPDLHPDNLLWEPGAGRVWLIDLAGARSRGRPLGADERAARLSRFARYFGKHAGAIPPPFATG